MSQQLQLTNAFYYVRVDMGPREFRGRWGQQVLGGSRVENGVRYFLLYFHGGATEEFPLSYLTYDLSGRITSPT